MKKYFTSFVAATTLTSFVAACGKKTNVKKTKKLTKLETRFDKQLANKNHNFNEENTKKQKTFVSKKIEEHPPVLLQKQQLKKELKKYFKSHYYTKKSEEAKFNLFLEKLNNYDFSEKNMVKMDSSVPGFSTHDLNLLSVNVKKGKWAEALSLVNKKSFGGKMDYATFEKNHLQELFSKNDKFNKGKKEKVKKLLTDYNFYHRNVNHAFTNKETSTLKTKIKEFLSKGKGLSSLRFYLWELDKYENLQMDYKLFLNRYLNPTLSHIIKDYKTNPYYFEVEKMLKDYKFYKKDLDKVYMFKDKGSKHSWKSFTKDEFNELERLIISYLLRQNLNKLTKNLKDKGFYLHKYSKKALTYTPTTYKPEHFHTKVDILKYLDSIDK